MLKFSSESLEPSRGLPIQVAYKVWISSYVLLRNAGDILWELKISNILSSDFLGLRCLLHIQGLVICFYLGWSGSILHIRQNIIKVGSKSWLLTCSSNMTLSLPSYTGFALTRELNFCNGYLSLMYFWLNLIENRFSVSKKQAVIFRVDTKPSFFLVWHFDSWTALWSTNFYDEVAQKPKQNKKNTHPTMFLLQLFPRLCNFSK